MDPNSPENIPQQSSHQQWKVFIASYTFMSAFKIAVAWAKDSHATHSLILTERNILPRENAQVYGVFFWTYAMKLEAAIQKWLFLCKKVLPKRSYIFPSPTPKCLEETWSPFHAIPAGFTEELTQRDQRKHQREIAHSLPEATVMDAQPGPCCQTPSGVCPVFEVGIKHPDGARHCQWGRKETPFHSLH